MKKIFVSHSSLDKNIIDVFIDKILKLGCGISPDDIAYTSRKDTGVRTGDDIKAFIKENISTCDFVFFMISENYAKSPICLNEMGAAWATDRQIIPVIFQNLGFDSLGWLYNVHQGIILNDSCGLDTLFEQVTEKYGHKQKVSAWNIYKAEFLNFLSENSSISDAKANLPMVISEIQSEGEMDLLDYRTIFDENIELHTACLNKLTTAIAQSSENAKRNTRNLNNLMTNPNATPTQARPILLKIAHDYDALSDVYDKETPLQRECFEKAINAGIKMREFSSLSEEEMQNERDAVSDMIEAMKGLLKSTISIKDSHDNNTNLDKTLTKSTKRLIECYDRMIETLNYCIHKANELLNYT